jgi:hypothetical protein
MGTKVSQKVVGGTMGVVGTVISVPVGAYKLLRETTVGAGRGIAKGAKQWKNEAVGWPSDGYAVGARSGGNWYTSAKSALKPKPSTHKVISRPRRPRPANRFQRMVHRS